MLLKFLLKGGFLAVILVLAGSAGVWTSFGSGRAAQGISTTGVTIDATVMSKRTAERTGGSGTSPNAFNPVVETEYFVTLDYTTNGAVGESTHRVERAVSTDYWEAVELGDRVTIQHLPGAPEVIELEAGATKAFATTAGWVGATLLFFGLLLGVILWRRTVHGVSLSREGLRVTGEVTGVRHSGGFSFLQYRFTDAAGTVHTGQSDAEEDRDFSDMPPGTPVAVLYDKKNPSRNILA